MSPQPTIRCIRLWTGDDQNSHFEEGWIHGEIPAAKAVFKETKPRTSLNWHTAPIRQLVVTLSGTLDFHTRGGSFQIAPGDILIAEDTTGSGHHWQMIGDDPWRRVYIVLEPGAIVPFRRKS